MFFVVNAIHLVRYLDQLPSEPKPGASGFQDFSSLVSLGSIDKKYAINQLEINKQMLQLNVTTKCYN